MAITGMDGLAAAMASGQRIVLQKKSATSVANFYYTLWTTAGNPGAGAAVGNISTGVIPTDATAGSPVIAAFTGGNTGYLLTFDSSSSVAGVLSVYDRVWHSGPHLTTTLHTDTITQPALTRVPGNNYGLIELWLEITVSMGATATTVTVSYQDGDNVTRTATLDSNLSGALINRMLPFRLANGTGIQKVNSVTIGGVLGAGSFNLVLQRNIQDHTCVSANIGRPKQGPFETGMPIIYADSCLAMMWLATGTATGIVYAEGKIGNG